jgi:hypothetical protein
MKNAEDAFADFRLAEESSYQFLSIMKHPQ